MNTVITYLFLFVVTLAFPGMVSVASAACETIEDAREKVINEASLPTSSSEPGSKTAGEIKESAPPVKK